MLSVLTLAAPVALSYLGLMLMGLVDTLILGRLGAVELGGAGVGNSIASWAMVTGIGLITGMDFPAASAIGAGRPRDAFKTFLQANHLSWLLGVPVTALLVLMSELIPHLGFDAGVTPFAKDYVFIVAFSMIPSFGFAACRGYLQAQGIAVPVAILLCFANVLNFFLNIGLIWGNWGLPELGFVGAAWATLIVRYLMYFFALGMVVHFDHRRQLRFFSTVPLRIDRTFMAPIIRLGFPGSMQMLLEVGVFSLATALAARLSATELAAHHIVLTTASLTFMIPLGVSSAAATLVGHAIGARNFMLARMHGWRALQITWIFMGTMAVCMFVFADPALRSYTSDEGVIAIAKSLILVAGLFQLSDGTQAVATGILRGAGETKTAAIANLIGHWFIGLPISIALGFYTSYRVFGLWVGLATGLTAVAIGLLVAWRRKIRTFAEPLPVSVDRQ